MAKNVSPRFDFRGPRPLELDRDDYPLGRIAHTSVREPQNDLAPAKFSEYERLLVEIADAIGDYGISDTVPGSADNLGAGIRKLYWIKFDKAGGIIEGPTSFATTAPVSFGADITTFAGIDAKAINIEWESFINYEEGDLVIWNYRLYRCIKPHVSRVDFIDDYADHWILAGAGGTTTMDINVAPHSHHFVVGDIIYYDKSITTDIGYRKAKSDDMQTVGLYMVVNCPDNHNFTFASSGWSDAMGSMVDENGDPLEPHTYYYLSSWHDGKITKHEQLIDQPVLYTYDIDPMTGKVEEGFIILTYPHSGDIPTGTTHIRNLHISGEITIGSLGPEAEYFRMYEYMQTNLMVERDDYPSGQVMMNVPRLGLGYEEPTLSFNGFENSDGEVLRWQDGYVTEIYQDTSGRVNIANTQAFGASGTVATLRDAIVIDQDGRIGLNTNPASTDYVSVKPNGDTEAWIHVDTSDQTNQIAGLNLENSQESWNIYASGISTSLEISNNTNSTVASLTNDGDLYSGTQHHLGQYDSGDRAVGIYLYTADGGGYTSKLQQDAGSGAVIYLENSGAGYEDGSHSFVYSNPTESLFRAWRSTQSSPEYTVHANGRFTSGKIYNAVWNDIAETVPSDGTSEPRGLVQVDLGNDRFRVCKYRGDFDALLGIHSEEPGFIVGWNVEYEDPVFIALKGMVWYSPSKKVLDMVNVGDRLFFTREGKHVCQTKARLISPYDVKELGIVLQKTDTSVKLFV